jgi:hypothetical protein
MSYIELYTDDELTQLKRIAVETRDMKTFKEVMEEMNRRQKYDL